MARTRHSDLTGGPDGRPVSAEELQRLDRKLARLEQQYHALLETLRDVRGRGLTASDRAEIHRLARSVDGKVSALRALGEVIEQFGEQLVDELGLPADRIIHADLIGTGGAPRADGEESPSAGSPSGPPQELSWIEIELLDEHDNPVAGEPYRVESSDGLTLAEGSLDAAGIARVERIKPGQCRILFPKLDSAAWERI